MRQVSKPIQFALMAMILTGSLPSTAQAGPLIDWLFGRGKQPDAYAVGPAVAVSTPGAGNVVPAQSIQPQGYTTNYGSYYGPRMPVIGPSGYGYTPPRPTESAAAVLPSQPTPPTYSYVPNYRTNAYRTPVTYYRPLVTTDPNTGAQIVTMSPCTSYEYQAQRVPAVGRRALFGSNMLPPVVPAPTAVPTYTLPSGGVAIAANVAPPSYSSAFRGYRGTVPAPVTMPSTGVAGTYPTAPLGSTTRRYGAAVGGGCTGSYQAPATVAPGYAAPANIQPAVPGLVAPQAPTVYTPAPGYGSITTPPGTGSAIGPGNSVSPGAPGMSPVYPGGGVPGTQQVLPGSPAGPPASGAPSSDPAADVQPSLGGTGASAYRTPPTTSRLRSFAQNPFRGESSQQGNTNDSGASTPVSKPDNGKQVAPLMSPIPVPDGFDPSPNWNPGLLNESDLTARAHLPSLAARYAGQSKKIHWASFEQPSAATPQPELSTSHPPKRLRPIQQPVAPGAALSRSRAGRSEATSSNSNVAQDAPARSRYDSSGWKTSRR